MSAHSSAIYDTRGRYRRNVKKAQAGERAVDLVMVAKSEREMKEMMSQGKYMRKKTWKTKMMVLNERKRKSEENEWKWEGRKVERENDLKSER
jgi:hypothetical protein